VLLDVEDMRGMREEEWLWESGCARDADFRRINHLNFDF
jgi:hypothetical protein